MKISQALDRLVLLAPVTAATTARTANLDTQGAKYATIEVLIGAELNTNSTNVNISLSESDDTVATNFATFNSVFNRVVDNTAGVVAVNHVDLQGRRRYLRLTVTPDTTTNGTVITGAIAALDMGTRGANSANGDSVAVG